MKLVADELGLRDMFGSAEGLAVSKSRPTLDKFSKQFIGLSPFLVLSTSNAKGKADVSPRGDPPGFVKIVDDKTLLIPDRPGNNRLDTMVNITENPNVAGLFFIPGFEDTLRFSGQARITNDQTLLASCAVNNKIPKAGVLVTVDEVFFHCAKALKRSKLWHEDYRADRKQMPSLAGIIMAQTCEAEPEAEEVKKADESVEENYRTELY